MHGLFTVVPVTAGLDVGPTLSRIPRRQPVLLGFGFGAVRRPHDRRTGVRVPVCGSVDQWAKRRYAGRDDAGRTFHRARYEAANVVVLIYVSTRLLI